MKKLVFAVALVGVLIGSVLGGIALADKPAAVKPLDTLGDVDQQTLDILEALGNVTDRLDDPAFGLEELKAEVAALEAAVAGLPRMESFSGNETVYIQEGDQYTTICFPDPDVVYPSIRNVHLTISINEGLIYDDGYVYVAYRLSQGDWHSIDLEDSGNYELEFDTTEWSICARLKYLAPEYLVGIDYAGTVTYTP
jgi:hypothetical protein